MKMRRTVRGGTRGPAPAKPPDAGTRAGVAAEAVKGIRIRQFSFRTEKAYLELAREPFSRY